MRRKQAPAEIDILDDDSSLEVVQQLRHLGFSWTDIAAMLKVSTKSLYRWRKGVGFDDRPCNRRLGMVATRIALCFPCI